MTGPQTSLFQAPEPDAERIAGVDEAGRGCLAGPVVAAAVILPRSFNLPGLADSKVLSAPEREALAQGIMAQAVAFAVGVASVREIERLNILQATFRAMDRALARLGRVPALALIDGDKTLPSHLGAGRLPQRAVVDGDALVPAISAASILAKTWRDGLMQRIHVRHPGYGFDVHKGYGTKAHREAIRRLGPCPFHRRTFRGVRPEEGRGEQACLPGT